MGISFLTAITIAESDDLVYTHAGPDENEKYAGWIIMPGGRPLLNTPPVFDTAELAEQHMTDVRDECKRISEDI